MRKGKFNIVLPFYAIVAFVLAILGQVLLCFVIAAERDEWAVRQCMQAFFLSIVSGIAGVVQSIMGVFNVVPVLNWLTSGITSFVVGVIYLVVLIFAIIGLVHVCKGQDARVPWLTTLAGKAYGVIAPHTAQLSGYRSNEKGSQFGCPFCIACYN